MRGAPHNGFAWLISRIKWRISAAKFGLPGRRRDFRVQYQANARRCQAITVSGRTMCRLWRQPATIARARPTRAGRSAGGADEATRSFGKRRVGDEARGSPPVVRHEFENWTLPERKGRRKESSSRYHQDLMNARNRCIFGSDGVFGNHNTRTSKRVTHLSPFALLEEGLMRGR